MRGWIYFALFMMYSGLVSAQSLNFVKFNDRVFESAREEGKMVLVYAYSPCRLCDDMSEQVLTLPEVVHFLEAHFILVDMDLDEREGVLFKREHQLKRCPSFLLFDERGKLVHKIAGVCSGEEFLAKIERGLDKRANYAMVKQRYEAGERSVDLLPDYLFALDDARELVDLSGIAKSFFSCFSLEELVSRKGWVMFEMCISDYRDSVFQVFLQNKEYFVRHVGEEQVNARIRQVVMSAFQSCLQDTSGVESPELLRNTIEKSGMPEREILGQLWTLHEHRDYASIMDVYEKEVFEVEPIFRSKIGDLLTPLMDGADKGLQDRVSAYMIKCLVDIRKRRSHVK